MNLVGSLLRRFARLYLIAVGGGFGLMAFVGLVENGSQMLRYGDERDIGYLRGVSFGLVFSILVVVTGVGIHKYRLWALVLALTTGILAVATGFANVVSDPWNVYNFTVVLPMVLIVVWASLPATWLEFRQHGAKS
jgi:hypothetical protein